MLLSCPGVIDALRYNDDGEESDTPGQTDSYTVVQTRRGTPCHNRFTALLVGGDRDGDVGADADDRSFMTVAMALFSGSFCYDTYCCSHLRHINRRHVWAGHLLDAARSAAARRHTCLSTASARL